MRIYNNINAVDAQRNLSITGMMLSKSIEKLSSGLRINRAADDAAGLSISEKLRAQINGLDQATRNAQDGISMIQTAEGALNEVHSMLQRMRELAVQAANDTLTAQDRQAINLELQQLHDEINAIAQRTTFNGKQLLTGSLTAQVAPSSTVLTATITGTGTDTASVSSVVADAKAVSGTYTISGTGSQVTLTVGSNSQTLDLSSVSLTAGQSYTLNFNQLGIQITVTADAGNSGAITGANIASGLDTKTVVVNNQSANFQVGANQTDGFRVAFYAVQFGANAPQALSALDTALNNFANAVNGTDNTAQVNAAQSLITAIDGGINYVSNVRSGLGAAQNRLEHAVANLGVAHENLMASESRIRDVDMAAEMVNFTRAQILQQAGIAVLAQANTIPQSILQLLR
jgi:flagellin